MFNNIVESVLNEISAEDAYVKFYSDIPKNMFNELLTMYGGKFDFLFKFVVNNLKESPISSTFNYAKSFLSLYKTIENNVRITFLNRLKNGEYEDLVDAIQGIKDIQEQGVSTVKTRQNEGYVEIYNDDKYLLTATLTYESSQHFYGKSKWCTASDRFGRYDGWYYFLSYIFSVEYVRSNNIYDNLGTKNYPLVCILVQFTDKTKNETYQAQVDKNGNIGQVCDFEDNSVDNEEFEQQIFPIKVREVLNREIPKLMDMEKKYFEIEYKYQTSRNEYVENKRKANEERNRILRKKMLSELEEEGRKKLKFIKTKYDSVVNSNLVYNKDFIKQIIKNSVYIKSTIAEKTNHIDNKESCEQLEELLKKQGYCYAVKFESVYENIVELMLRPIFGLIHDVTSEIGRRPTFCNYFSLSRSHTELNDELNGCFIYFLEVNNAEHFEELFDIYGGVDSEEFEKLEILNIIEAKSTEGTFGVRNVYNFFNFPNTSERIKISKKDYEGFNLLEEHLIDGSCKMKLYNFKNNSSVTLNTDTMLKNSGVCSIIPYKNLLLFSFYTDLNENEFVIVNINKMKITGTMIANHIERANNCYILYDVKTMDIYIMTNKLYKTGVKLVNDENYISAKMFDNLIVFTNNTAESIENYCKVFDCNVGKIIVDNGKMESFFDEKFYYYRHNVINKDTGEKIELD